MNERRISHAEDCHSPTGRLQVCAGSPNCIAADRVEKSVYREPQAQRHAIRKFRQWREQQRNLWPIQWDVQEISRLRYSFRGHRRLGCHVVQICSPMLQRERTQRVEMEKIRALQKPVTIAQSRSREGP